jgi:outer membrane protein TolC
MLYNNIKLYKLFVAICFCNHTMAQTPADTLIKIKDAVQLAEQNYHLLKAGKYEADAAAKNVEVIKYGKVPTIDATYQAGIGTANNLTGIFYPSGILPMTGPPSATNDYTPATGSAAGILLNWQAVTFGERNALIDVSIAEANSKKSEWQQAVFSHKVNVISAYLDLLLAYDVVSVLRQNIQRVETNLKQSRILANTGIKPGVDTALFLSELSKAKIDFLNAQRQLQTQQWILAQLIVTDKLPVPSDSTFLRELPAATVNRDTLFSKHPLIQFAQSQFQLSESKEFLLRKSYLPKLNVWGTGFARGSGFQQNGTIKTWDGLGLSRYNYGAGVQLAFPIMKYGEVKKQLHEQDFLSKAAAERIEEDKAALLTQQHIASTTFENSITIAVETEQQLKSGQYAFTAMQVRYNTGLVNFADLIQTQYNLLKAELDVKKAFWDAWKALLLQAAVQGDETIFLNETK